MSSVLPTVRDAGLDVRASLPSPPSDTEKYWYMGRQHRWLLWVQSLSFALIGVSVLRFALSDPRMLLFLAPFSLFAVALVVSLCSSTRAKRTSRLDHEFRVLGYAPERFPSVDVFLPSAGEDLALLRNTYDHVRAMAWPGELMVHVLDDSDRREVADLAAAAGFRYHARPDRGHLKKAGNLRYGFEHTHHELIVVLDADFVPRVDFLAELVPYFEDSEVGIVQSPQFFDAVKGMHWLQRSAGATQELFYRWIQPARDRSRAAICVGTCAIYRREALVAAGGFAQIEHSEDVHTGVKLMRAGYRVSYVPILVSKGLCPDTVGAFLNQQYRWCTGSMSLLRDNGFHEDAAITGRQRLTFWAGFLYYITTALNVYLAVLPALAMVWVLPQYVHPENSRWLLGALALWFVVLPLTFRSRWRVDVLRVQTLYGFAHSLAVLDTLTGRTKEWVATGTARATPISSTVLRVAKVWTAVTTLALWVGLVRGVAVFGIQDYWAMVALACLAAYVQVPILFLRDERARPRRGRSVVLPGHSSYRAPIRARLATLVRRARPDGAGDRTGPGSGHWRPDIQGLRAVAVLLVVLYHAGVPGITGGYVGVDVFFVISGFLITGNLVREVERTGRIDLVGFYARRVRRLAAPAAIVILATVLAARAYDSLFQVRAVLVDGMYAAVNLINYHLAADGVNYQRADGPVSPLQHYWSLAVEEQFYLLWPLLVLGLVAVSGRHRRAAIALALIAVTGASVYWSLGATVTNQPLAYFSLHTRAWELGAGALLALAGPWLARRRWSGAAPLGWLGLVVVVGSALAYDDSTVFPGSAALLPVAGCLAVIAAGCRPSRSGAGLVLEQAPLQGIGRVSYAWYLWHWPLLVLIPLKLGYEVGWVTNVTLVLLGLWFAVITLYLVELPSGRSRRRRRVWLGFGGVAAAVSAVVCSLLLTTVPALVGTGAATSVAAGNTREISSDIVRGTLIQASPTNLTPSLDAVADDQPASTRDGCHAGFLQVKQGECVYGDPAGRRTMVLLGDSHAQQWLPGLDLAARDRGWRLISWTKAACPIADVTVRSRQLGNRVYSECDTWREATLERVEELHPDAVVLSQSDLVTARQVSNTDWADATASTVSRLQQEGLTVQYVLDTPTPPSPVPDCVANNLDKVEPCMFRRDDAYPSPGRHDAVAAALGASGGQALEPADWFCTPVDSPTEGKCPVVVGNLLVYRDATHVSTAYSAYLAPALLGLFRVPAS